MAHPNEDLVREAFAAFGRGDMDALQKTWAEDIRGHLPGRSPLAGHKEGIPQVLEGFALLAELSSSTYSAELHYVLANDEHAMAMWTSRAERAGKQLNDNQVATFNILDGKVSEVWIYQTDAYAQDEFWS